MNNTSLAVIQRDDLDTIKQVGTVLAKSGYFGTAANMEVAVAQLAAKIMAGRELGFGPFASANNIHIIQGRPSIGAYLMASAVKSSGRYDYRVRTMTNDLCKIEFFEREGDKLVSVGMSDFSKEDANAAGTQNMTKFPRNMLFARAMSNGVKWYCPDVFNGNAVYVPEELGAEVDGDGNVIDTTYTVSKPSVDVNYYTKDVAQDAPTMAQQATVTIEGNSGQDDANDGPTDEELAILGTWHNQREAQQWAVEVGACDNMHHAGESWMKVVRENKGFNQKNAGQVYLGFLRRQQRKLAQQLPTTK